MRLKFLKVRAKNFRSIGNMFMEFDYTAAPKTLVTSTNNGAGKCVRSNSILDIEFDDKEMENKFIEFMKNRNG